MKTYKLVKKNGQTGIKCLMCRRISWNENDVKYKYCGYCHKFHDQMAAKMEESLKKK